MSFNSEAGDRAMGQQVEQTWEQEVFARGEVHGALQIRRGNLRAVLEARFGALPEALVQRIEATEDRERLRAALLRAVRIPSLDEFQL
jgi:hypothetical protein